MPKDLFAVLIMPNNGGHGPWPAVVQITDNPMVAVQTARKVEKLGYALNWPEDEVRIDRLASGKIYSREDICKGYVVVYRRTIPPYKEPATPELDAEELFFDPQLAKMFNVSVSVDGKPSRLL